jgi:hypothetical protein
MSTPTNPTPSPCPDSEALRLEAVSTCVGFDDILDVTLSLNHPHLDTMIVVTTHNDKKTQLCAQKHGAICVQTDLFKKNGRVFNKGAAINSGFGRFQYHGWRMHLDSDIILPDNFRRMVFNHTTLDKACIYGADRVDVIGYKEVNDLRNSSFITPQASYGFKVDTNINKPIGSRYVDPLRGYVPIGYFQMWYADSQHPYPWSLGTAAHDDVMFGEQWCMEHRRLLPTTIVYHLNTIEGRMSQNWEGRTTPRLK